MPCQDDGQADYYDRIERRNLKKRLDRVTAMLCEMCQRSDTVLPPDIREWFQKHREADRKRIAAEQAAETAARAKAAALDKLTPEEKRLLGLK